MKKSRKILSLSLVCCFRPRTHWRSVSVCVFFDLVCVCVILTSPGISRSANTKVCHPSQPAPLTGGRDIGRAQSSGLWSCLACLGSLCIFSQDCMQTPTVLCVLCSYGLCVCACVRVLVSVTTPDVCFNTPTQLHVLPCCRTHTLYIHWHQLQYMVLGHMAQILRCIVYLEMCVCVCLFYLMHALVWSYLI